MTATAEHVPVTFTELREALILIAVGCQTTPSRISRQLLISQNRGVRILGAAIERGLVSVGHPFENDESFTLTSHGSSKLSENLETERISLVPRPRDVMSKFEPLDGQFKAITLDILNEGFDGRTVAHLDRVAVRAMQVLDDLSGWGVRFRGYRNRLENAANNLLNGRQNYLVDPGVDSAHGIWWEWHTDLKLVAGLSAPS